jgi:ferrochelatase
MERAEGDVAVLVTCHGTVESANDIPEFVTRIRHGRRPPEDVVQEVSRRFTHIGGSPLMVITHQQAAALQERIQVPVRAAARLWQPSPADVARPLVERGVKRIVSLPLAPQSVHVYNSYVVEQLASFGVEVVETPAYGLEPALVAAFVEAIEEARGSVPAEMSFALLLTAHSLPTRVLASGDPYQRDFEAMAAAVTAALVARGYDSSAIHIAYQSQGMGGGDWLGPDLSSTMARVQRDGRDALLIAPIGFVAEHVETLYDIDVEAAALARDMGFSKTVRMPAMNTRSAFIDALQAVVTPLLA